MNIILNYRRKNEKLEELSESLCELGHTLAYDIWDIGEIVRFDPGAVIFEFKQILKEELRYARLSRDLKKAGIPSVTWCLDIPGIGAKPWKLGFVLKTGLVDVFATHSMQGLVDMRGVKSRLMYLPNAAWTSRYNLGGASLEDLRNNDRYSLDVSFIGNLDSAKYREHKQRTDFLSALAVLLKEKGLSYRFEDGRRMEFAEQIDLIQRSRININFGCAADRNGNRSWGMPERCYGVPACGGFLLSDERVHAKDDFAVGEEIVMFRNIDDCLDKIMHYKSAFDESRAIAERAYRRVMTEHTYVNRAEKLLAAVKGIGGKPERKPLKAEKTIARRSPKVSIIILNWNKLEYTKKCIESIEDCTAYPNYEIIIFDNGSTEPGTHEYLRSLKHKTVLSSRNLGFAKGNNKAVSFASGEMLLFLNNDTIAHKGWLEEMLKTLDEYPDCGIVGSKLLYPDGTIQHIGVVIGNKGNRYHSYKGYPADIPPALKLNECEAVTGACLLVARDIFLGVEGFDEGFLHGSEDIDLCFKVRSLGMKVVYCPTSVLTHFEQVSFREKGRRFRKRITRLNDRLFMKKWGDSLESFRLPNDFSGLRPRHYYNHARPEIMRLMPEEARFILDIGCSSGMLGKAIKEAPGLKTVWGIEINEDFAKEARKYLDRVIVKNIEEEGPVLDGNVLFDCIICADVLEHLKDPWTALSRLSAHLAPGGRLIASIPNIQYYKVVRDVITDRWLYRSEGILDRDHLRFFSLVTIKNLFAISGYKIVSVQRNKKASKLLKVLNALFFRKLDKFLTQQYLVVCKRRNDV